MAEALESDSKAGGCRSPYAYHFTQQIIETIDRGLDSQEQISMMFLLCGLSVSDIEITLQKMIAYASRSLTPSTNRQRGLLLEWTESQKTTDWQAKITEALCVIQNYRLAKYLGVTEERRKFLSQYDMSTSGMKHWKVLYYICNNLTDEEAVRLAKYMQPELRTYGTVVSINDCLEINILKSLSCGYLKLPTNTCNFWDTSKLVALLVKLDRSELAELLWTHLPKSVVQNQSNFINCDSANANTGMHTLSPMHSIMPLLSQQSSINFPSYDYDMAYCRGLCLIINQRNFIYNRNDIKTSQYGVEQLDDRIGTDFDRDQLHETFTMFGFCFGIFENKTSSQLLSELRMLAEQPKMKHFSMLVVCILSHGQKDHIFGTDCVPVDIMEIVSIFNNKNCPHLFQRPRLYIIQACQGRDCQNAITNSDVVLDSCSSNTTQSSVPEVGDQLIFCASVPGYASFRSKTRGSPFIRILCESLQSEPHHDKILEEFTEICAKVSSLAAEISGQTGKRAMMPEFRCALRKKVEFHRTQPGFFQSLKMIAVRLLMENLLREYIKSRSF